MSTVSAIAHIEIRLLLRQRAYWVVHGLLGLPALVLSGVSIYFRSTGLPAIALWGTGYVLEPMMFLVLFLLLIPVIAAPAINQHWGKMGEVLWSTPLEPFTHQAGLFLGLWLGMLPGILLQFATWILVDLFFPDPLSDLRFLYALGLILVTVTIALGMCLLLCALLRHTLVVMIAWVAGWVFLFLSISPLEEFHALQLNWPYNLYFNNLIFSPSLGLGADGPIALGMVLWFLGIAIAAAILGLLVSLLFDRRRSMSRALPVALAGGVALILAGSGFAAGSRAVEETQVPPSPFNIQPDAWQVLNHHLEAEVDPKTAEVRGSSQLTLKSRLSDPTATFLVLRLNPGLQVERVLDGDGNELAFTRYGDGLTVELTVQPGAAASLDLEWGGKLHLPFDAFGQRWVYYGQKDVYNYYSPHASRGLLWDGVGYLMRDGDWYPWPWVSGPHRALEQKVSLRTTAANCLASTSLKDGVFTWEGDLPQQLLVFPPSRRVRIGTVDIYSGSLTGTGLQRRFEEIAIGASRMLQVLEEPQLRYLVALPYLDQFFHSGDTLLIPEGSGHYLSEPLYVLYGAEAEPALLERSAMTLMARAWLLERYQANHNPFKQVSPQGDRISFYFGTPSFSEATWEEEHGRWAQLPESQELDEYYFLRQGHLTDWGELSVAAFWMAMELADPEVREGDLELILAHHQDTKPGYGKRALELGNRKMPNLFASKEAQRLLWGLHQWSETVGTEQALEWAVEALSDAPVGSTVNFLERLTELSGVEVKEVVP